MEFLGEFRPGSTQPRLTTPHPGTNPNQGFLASSAATTTRSPSSAMRLHNCSASARSILASSTSPALASARAMASWAYVVPIFSEVGESVDQLEVSRGVADGEFREPHQHRRP